MKQSKELRRAHAAWESWVAPVDTALDTLTVLSELPDDNLAKIRPRELRRIVKAFERVMREAYKVSCELPSLDRRIAWAKEDAGKD